MSRINETLLVIRNGEIKLRLPSVEQRADGSLWQSGNPLLDAEATGAPSRDVLAKMVKSKKFDSIPAGSFAKRGENPSGLLVLTQEEWDDRQPLPPFGRFLQGASNGQMVLVHEVSDQLDATLEFAGCLWNVTGTGKSFTRARWTIRYGYLTFVKIINPQEAYREMVKLRNEESERAHRDFEKMMNDENNDGVRPGRGVPVVIDLVLDCVRRAHPEVVEAAKQRYEQAARSRYDELSDFVKSGS